MNRRLQWSAALVLMAFSATASAQATGLGFKMINTRDNPFRYHLDARRPTPAGISLAQVETATNAAFQTWENVGCAYPDFQYMGRITTGNAVQAANIGDKYDGLNVSTIWVTDAMDPYYQSVLAGGNARSGTARVTFEGFLYRCDIFINAVDYKWTTLPTTDPQLEFLDLQTAITHEVGHCLGLADNQVPLESVMNPIYPVGSNRRTLVAEDVELLCNTYPENGAVGSPCSASDPCTNGLTCVPFTQNGTVLYRYCSKSCPNVTTAECPSPFTCEPSNLIAGATHACLAVPNKYVTQVGKACDPTQPNVLQVCGSGFSVCQGPVPNLPSGATAWANGYCQETCLAGEPTYKACPTGSICANTARDPQDPQDPDPNKDVLAQDRCLKSCNPGGSDCRQGYSCAPLAQGNACVPSCYADDDCGQGYSCRPCDRVCLPSKPSGRSVGDPCTNTDQCGTGLACLFFGNVAQGVCTQTCGTGTGACGCPIGSTCKTVGGSVVCMKDCAQSTCAFPLQCNPVGTSLSCVPACRTNADCEAGYQCTAGGCVDPSQGPDGGCTLCSDGGTPPPPPDGGGGGEDEEPQGCGCSGAPASAFVFFAALALVLILAGGRRSWQDR
jgi:hypothetical protein